VDRKLVTAALAALISLSAAVHADDSIDLTPLTDMAAGRLYKGQAGGLYGGGLNTPPRPHQQFVMDCAAQVQPLDRAGRPAPDGRIALVSVGMSNTTQEFAAFARLALADPMLAPRVALVDGGQGNQDAADWANPDTRSNQQASSAWEVLAQRMARADVTAAQVQVAWIKQARRGPARLGEFPAHAQQLAQDLRTIIARLHATFPNLKLVYLSSRTYAGHARGGVNPEPYAYESAFAVRWVIEDQANAVNRTAPAILWGPYFWADGVRARRDGLSYTRDDFAPDCVHPSPAGCLKVASQMLAFFKSDPSARPWFVAANP
jgi:hypothetical protein